MNEMSNKPDLIGHNSEAMALPSAEAFIEWTREDTGEIHNRLLDLAVGIEKLPETVDEKNAGTVSDFIGQIQKALKDAEADRKARKAPILELGKKLDDYFKKLTARCEKGAEEAKKKLGVYQKAKAEEERRIAEEARRKAEAEAEAERQRQAELDRQAEEAAKAAKTDEERRRAAALMEEASQAEEAAQAAEKAAAGVKEGKGNVAGEYGATTAYVRKTWVFDVRNLAAVPVAFVQINEKAVREYIREAVANGETPEIPGIAFSQSETTVVKAS